MHGFSVSLLNLIFGKGMSLNQAYFSTYNNVFKHGSSVSWWFLFNPSWTPLCQLCFQDRARFLCTEPQNVGQITSFQVWRTWIKHTFQIIARCSRTEYQFLGKISVFHAWLVCFMHNFSSYTKGFMHAISESCRTLFKKSGMHLYWTDFAGYSKISARILRFMENSFRSKRDALSSSILSII